jgi:nucleotide-binding universal stress UspA family protein
MKTIIAPVDFSDASANALSFAAELSKRASARLIVLNILQKGESELETRDKLKSLESGSEKNFRLRSKL